MQTEKLREGIQRYRRLGGLPSALRRYERGEVTLAEIASAIGFSRETVRSDFKRHLGEGEFREVVERRREARRQRRAAVSLDIAAARARLAREMREADEPTKKELRVLSQVLGEMSEAGVPLSVTVAPGGSMKFALADGRGVNIRVAVVGGSLKEHKIGFHRFKITPGVARYPFSVFALGVGDEALVFVFKSSDIAGVRSLNLRFAAESKYDITRKSKYDKARSNWAILKSRVR
jgi:DNA-binding Lrp family transcriptional regulator